MVVDIVVAAACADVDIVFVADAELMVVSQHAGVHVLETQRTFCAPLGIEASC